MSKRACVHEFFLTQHPSDTLRLFRELNCRTSYFVFHMICCLSVAGKYDTLIIKLTAWRHVFLMEFGSV